MNTMAERIQHALTLRGMTPSDLIRQKVLSKAGVYFLLDGTTTAEKVRATTVAKLCKALGVNRDWLLSGRGPIEGQVNGHTLESSSQPARIDASILAKAIEHCRSIAKRLNVEYDPGADADATVMAYEMFSRLPANPPMADVIDFGAAVAARLGRHEGPNDGSRIKPAPGAQTRAKSRKSRK